MTAASTTPSTLAPYLQISKVVWRSLGLSKARWLYVALACCLTITALGGGITWKWGMAALWEAAAIAAVTILQIAWPFFSTTLMRLNTPTAARTVPHYVGHLRRTALVLWLGICVITGLLQGHSIREAAVMGFGAGAFMLFISTPWRWPVQWCMVIAVLAFLGSRSHEIVKSDIVKAMFSSPASGVIFAMVCYVWMAWLVTRLIAGNGSGFAALYSRVAQRENAVPGADTPARLPAHALGPLLGVLQQGWQLLLFPWRLYLRRALALPSQPEGSKAQATQVLARALLGLGPNVHWVMQVGAMLVLWGFVMLKVVIVPMIFGTGVSTISGGWAILIALGSLMAAVAPVLSLPETFRTTAPEQKLMLLLPGMPRGDALNHLLAVRHVRHAFVAWLVAVVSVVALPYQGASVFSVAGIYMSALVLLPMVVSDWSRIQPPNAMYALAGLLRAILAPGIGLIAVHWLGVPINTVAAAAVVYCGTMLVVRWRRLPQFAPAFPAGRLLRKEVAHIV
jgi:hypothetical protein